MSGVANPKNIENPVIQVYHRNMMRMSDSMYRTECPFCTSGCFLIIRDRETFILQEFDRCIACGQLVQWVDIEEMRAWESRED